VRERGRKEGGGTACQRRSRSTGAGGKSGGGSKRKAKREIKRNG